MAAISIITPTCRREALLMQLHGMVLAQGVQDFEWLILDESPRPCLALKEQDDGRILVRFIERGTGYLQQLRVELRKAYEQRAASVATQASSRCAGGIELLRDAIDEIVHFN